jgi:hypothetical protein
MRKILFAGAALALAAPAVAQQPVASATGYDDAYEAEADRGYDDYVTDDRGEAPVLDGRDVAEMGQTMDRLVGAVMDLPIGGIVAAVDPEGRSAHRRNETVRDMATRGDPEAEARIRGGIHASTAGIGAMSEALAQMMPVFRRSMEEMERSMDRAMRAYRRD